MQKVKLQIKGMHCRSCAALIEEKLKHQPGISVIKVNYESQKAAIVFDEIKISENEICQTIENNGEYQLERLNDSIGEESDRLSEAEKPPAANPYLVPLSILVAGLVIAGAVVYSRGQITLPLGANAGNSGQGKNDLAGNPPSPENNQGPVAFNITQDDHVRGDFSSPVTLVEFSDFECPFCERHFPTMNKILSDYQGKVRLGYKHFPLSIHPNSQKAAESSECASEQGKFWEYHDKLFQGQPSGFSTEKFKQWARDLGLDSNRFDSCLDSGKYADRAKKDYQEGISKGVNGTPATFVNGNLVSGAYPYDTFKQAIDSLLNK